MNPKKNKRLTYRNPAISLAVSVCLIVIGSVAIDSLGIQDILRQLIGPLCRLMVFITIGLAMGQLIEAAGWTAKIGMLGAPLFRFARLGSHCSAAFSAGFFSIAAANAMLYGYWQDKQINRHQLILANLANQLPAFFLHLPTTVFIVIPLTGWAGGLYFILTFIAAVMRFMLVLVWGRLFLGADISQGAEIGSDAGHRKNKAPVRELLTQKLPKRMVRIATYVVPIYIVVFLFNQAGFFKHSQQWLALWFTSHMVPVEALSLIVLGFVAEFTSGFAAAGAMLNEGVISIKQATLALLMGNILAFPIRALRHQLPRLMGIFAPRLGIQILLLGQGVRILSLIVVGGIYYCFF